MHLLEFVRIRSQWRQSLKRDETFASVVLYVPSEQSNIRRSEVSFQKNTQYSFTGVFRTINTAH